MSTRTASKLAWGLCVLSLALTALSLLLFILNLSHPNTWTCVGSVDCLRLRTVRGEESSATNKPGIPTGVSPRGYPAG